MKKIVFNQLIILVFLVFIAPLSEAGWFNRDDALHVADINPVSSQHHGTKNAATLRRGQFVDARAGGLPPNQLGVSNQHIAGISVAALMLDQPLTDLVAGALKKRFDDNGYSWQDNTEGNALYEVSAVVKEFVYNVKERDEIALGIETTVTEVVTGAVIWSGFVVEKSTRFAGVTGNSKADISAHLRRELGVVTKKTFDAIHASLLAARPDLFSQSAGVQAVDGVLVLQSTHAQPVLSANNAAASSGTLQLSSQPARGKVYVDGVYFGLTPLRADMPAGVHRVNVKLDGFATLEEKISIRSGQITELDMPFLTAQPTVPVQH